MFNFYINLSIKFESNSFHNEEKIFHWFMIVNNIVSAEERFIYNFSVLLMTYEVS